jgi:hypothetical protein
MRTRSLYILPGGLLTLLVHVSMSQCSNSEHQLQTPLV